jgi:hypothetical protein
MRCHSRRGKQVSWLRNREPVADNSRQTIRLSSLKENAVCLAFNAAFCSGEQ